MSDDPLSAYQSPITPQQQPQSMPPSPGSQPPSIAVFGILNLVFAGLGLCGSCSTVAMWFLWQAMPDQPQNPVFELMQKNQALYIFTVVSTAFGFVAVAVLALAGYGLLKMRPWGRQLSIIYAVYTIIATTVRMIANWVWLAGPMMDLADLEPVGPGRVVALFSAYGSVFGNCFSFVYPIILLIFMMRSNIVQAFRNQYGGNNLPSY